MGMIHLSFTIVLWCRSVESLSQENANHEATFGLKGLLEFVEGCAGALCEFNSFRGGGCHAAVCGCLEVCCFCDL